MTLLALAVWQSRLTLIDHLTEESFMAADDSYLSLGIWNLLNRLRLGTSVLHSARHRLRPQMDAAGRRVLDDRDWNLLHTRRPRHTLEDSGRPGCAAACADVFCF